MFKAGQKVRVKTEKEILKQYKTLRHVPYTLTPNMEEYLGKVVVVFSCREDPHERNGFLVRLRDDGFGWTWHSSVLEPDNIVTKKVFDVLRGL